MSTQQRRKRIVVVRHHPFWRDPLLRRNMAALAAAGFEVDLICGQEPGLPLRERLDGITIIRIPLGHRRGSLLGYFIEYTTFAVVATVITAMRCLLRRYDYVEIGNMPDWNMLAALVLRALGAKVSFYMYENMPDLLASDREIPPTHPAVRLLVAMERACAAVADCLIAPHDMAAHNLVRQGIPADKIVVVPNVPNEDIFLANVQDSPGSRPVQPPSDFERFTLVTHGSLLERYGIQTLLEAIAMIGDTIPGLHLDIIGDGEYRPQLERLAVDLGVQARVSFLGSVPYQDVAPRLLAADVGVVPMWADFVPNKLMEYLTLGMPAITTGGSALRLYFDEDEVEYVEPRDAADLARAIGRLYHDPERRISLARAGERAYRERFAWDRSKDAYLGIYGTHVNAGSDEDARGPVRRMSWLGFVLKQSRGPRNTLTRLPTIVARFGITARKSERHLDTLLAVTGRHNVRPTLPVTAAVARRHPDVVRNLQARGVEIAAHGLVHNDLRALTRGEQIAQVQAAREELENIGLRITGWRCPYSRWNDDTLAAIRAAGLEYDATPVYVWPALDEEGIELPAVARASDRRFHVLSGALPARTHAVLPSIVDGLVQIPMSIPQDEDMVDRLHLDETTVSRVWQRMLHDARHYGETLVLCLHPERAAMCANPLDEALRAARELGDVWLPTLGEVAAWWRARDAARVHVHFAGEGRWRIDVEGPDSLATACHGHTLVGAGSFTVETLPQPTVHCGPAWSDRVRRRLHEAGFLVVNGHVSGHTCALDLDTTVAPDAHPDEIVRAVVARAATSPPLVRLAPWPAPYRSCLCVTGDIDAITVIDFALRLKEF